MKTPFWILLLFLISISIRLYFNYLFNLIPGVNGGYYPVQVRAVFETGHTGFGDMPLLFFLDAAILRLLAFLGLSVTDTTILHVVKIIDSLSLPFLLFPLYIIVRSFSASKFLTVSMLAFGVLSFSPLLLTSDLQKNALAVVFLMGTFAGLFTWHTSGKRRSLAACIVMLILTGLTHFGTFMFGLFFLLLFIFHLYRLKAVIPMVVGGLVSLGIIFTADYSRFIRVFSFWTELFQRPFLFSGMVAPPELFNILFSIVVAMMGFMYMWREGQTMVPFRKAILFASIICLLGCSFPLLEAEYVKRLSIFLFIPQMVIILLMASGKRARVQRIAGGSLTLLTVVSIFALVGNPNVPVMDDQAFEDLKKIRKVIPAGNETLVVARHGLEWWTAWVLHTRVAQEKALDRKVFDAYSLVVVLNQLDGFGVRKHGTPFHEPSIPVSAERMYTSEYFLACRLEGDDWQANQTR